MFSSSHSNSGFGEFSVKRTSEAPLTYSWIGLFIFMRKISSVISLNPSNSYKSSSLKPSSK